jgi:hypothetical protein
MHFSGKQSVHISLFVFKYLELNCHANKKAKVDV